MAALTAAVLIGFELVLTHWFYLYLPWFFPFVVLALIAPLPGAATRDAAGRGSGLTRSSRRALFLACFGLVHTWFWAHGELVDWPTYQSYGAAIVDHHRVPYRDFAVDYPPGALPVFVVPAFFGDYASAFEWVMAACGVALVGVLAFVRREAAYYAALAPLLVGSLILSRFDLWPALLLVAALAALLAGRDCARLGASSARRSPRSSGRSSSCRPRSSGRRAAGTRRSAARRPRGRRGRRSSRLRWSRRTACGTR